SAIADNAGELLHLARIRNPEQQHEIAMLIASGRETSVYGAEMSVRNRSRECRECGEAPGASPAWHCSGCGKHPRLDQRICGTCGGARPETVGEPIGKHGFWAEASEEEARRVAQARLLGTYREGLRQVRTLIRLHPEPLADAIMA